MTDLMALDTESGRLIKKTRFGEDGGGGGAGSSGAAGSGGAGSGGGSGSSSPVKASRRKPRSGLGVFVTIFFPAFSRGCEKPIVCAFGSQQAAASSPELFEVFVGKEDFKFSSSHFVAFDGFRERLHGHNYTCTVRLKGEVSE
ncbi:unnamed protein product, partial [Laminaria digitata]